MSGYELDKPSDPTPPVPPSPPDPPKRSLLEDTEDQPCPSCKKPLPPGTVVCMSCGYDMLSGGKARTTVGEEELPPPIEPIVREKGFKQKPATVLGILLLLVAAFFACWFCKSETYFHIRVLRGLLVIVEAATAVGTGLVGVWFASWLLHRPFGRADLAAARLLFVISAFLLFFNASLPGDDPGTFIKLILMTVKLALAFAAYWFGMLLLIGRDIKTTQHIVVAHVSATVIILAQSWLWSITAEAIQW